MSVYCCSDLHGRYDLYVEIKKFLKPEDKVYFLGDATDRGPDSWKLFKAIISDPQWIFICGNHEELLARAIDEYCDTVNSGSWWSLADNGGAETFEDWVSDGAWQEWSGVIRKLPYYEEYINNDNWTIIMTHAGFTPTIGEDGKMIKPTRRECLWNRDHFCDSWDFVNFDDTLIIHGHTPIPFQLYTEREKIDNWNDPGVLYYCNDRKINLDCGAVWINATVLLDLDTLEEYVFQFE